MVGRGTIALTDRVHEQCLFETNLASRLRNAPQKDRMRLYNQVYDEYQDQYPECLPGDGIRPERNARYETSFLSRFLTPSTVMAEIGPGRCHVAFAVAPLVAKIYGVDVMTGAASSDAVPNFEWRLTNGINMPFDSDSIDLVFSNQLMEHLHPDDANQQLQEIYRVLRKGGRYICVTPSRVNGPHDCSAYFDDLPCPVRGGDYQATGLHLKEYVTADLLALFKSAGFMRMHTWIGARGRYFPLPPGMIAMAETALRLVPPEYRKRSTLLSIILGNRVCVTK